MVLLSDALKKNIYVSFNTTAYQWQIPGDPLFCQLVGVVRCIGSIDDQVGESWESRDHISLPLRGYSVTYVRRVNNSGMFCVMLCKQFPSNLDMILNILRSLVVLLSCLSIFNYSN